MQIIPNVKYKVSVYSLVQYIILRQLIVFFIVLAKRRPWYDQKWFIFLFIYKQLT